MCEISIVMPCLNEERTLGQCVEKARAALEQMKVSWEIIVADNGSTDDSVEIAASLGVRVVNVPKRGYGNAYIQGINESHGKYIVIGDSDESYDFSEIERFILPLREGYDMVMGNRLGGRIMPGAMPWHHRYIGNPFLSGFLNILYRTGVSDCHCGMRSFTREAFDKMRLKTTGMEFASEMVIKAAKASLKIKEIPITLYKDGRDRKPHLRSFSDGWRHLRFMLAYSPTYLFLVPGLLFICIGLFLFIAVGCQMELFGHRFDTHISVIASMLSVLGFQIVATGIFVKVIFWIKGWMVEEKDIKWFVKMFNLEHFLLSGFAVMLLALLMDIYIVIDWARNQFGPLHKLQLAIFAATLFVISIQWMFASFFIYILKDTE